MSFPSHPQLPAEPGEPAAPGSLITVEDGDILMRRGLQDYAPSAQVHVVEAAHALEEFRLGGGPGRLASAETSADKAITTFESRTGERDAAAWHSAVLYMVELRAVRHGRGRLAVFDPAPPPPSLFTPGSPMRLERVSREAHEHILAAGRSLERAQRGDDTMDVARAQHAVYEAAQLLVGQLPGLSVPLWVLIARFCAETHAETLRQARAGDPYGAS
ncbi:hypothetical protein ABZ896_12240 [Streptomyces sp. NPDC047072]|uniref:hypothetical protein n=1 Tax=Streptomyces sp. NPDC047072 TaxID=3154809 RepID=UPI0033DDC10D